MVRSQLEAISLFGWWVDSDFTQDLQSVATYGWFMEILGQPEQFLFVLDITRRMLMACGANR